MSGPYQGKKAGETEFTLRADTINFDNVTGAVMSGPIAHWLQKLEFIQQNGYPEAKLFQRNCGVLHLVELVD